MWICLLIIVCTGAPHFRKRNRDDTGATPVPSSKRRPDIQHGNCNLPIVHVHVALCYMLYIYPCTSITLNWCFITVKDPAVSTMCLLRLLELLCPAKTKWFNLGLCLGLRYEDLESIEKKRPDDADRLREMLRTRLKSSNISRKELLQALRSPTVGYMELARELQ